MKTEEVNPEEVLLLRKDLPSKERKSQIIKIDKQFGCKSVQQ